MILTVTTRKPLLTYVGSSSSSDVPVTVMVNLTLRYSRNPKSHRSARTVLRTFKVHVHSFHPFTICKVIRDPFYSISPMKND